VNSRPEAGGQRSEAGGWRLEVDRLTALGNSKPLSVLVGITSKSWGGNEKWATEAALGLAGRGHRVTVFWSHEPLLRELEARGAAALGVELRRVNLWGDVNPVGLASLARLLRETRPDVLLLTKKREYWMGGLTARVVGRPLVALRLGTNRPLTNDLKRRLVFGRFADVVIVNSEMIRETITAAPWLPADRVVVLHNGVDTSEPRRDVGAAFLTRLGAPPGSPVVAGVGRLASLKGFGVLMEAFREVRESFPGARLLILGEGGQRARLEAVRSRLGLEGSVLMPGHADDVRDILSRVDAYVLSSRIEGMANTLLEAMSVGAPIVATDVSGTTEAVRPGIDGLVVPPDNPAALAEALGKLLGDRDLAARLGESARTRAAEMFGMDRMVHELEGMLKSALDDRRREQGASR
jgi:glycosyltransferase involved in cell wall biosynthesis